MEDLVKSLVSECLYWQEKYLNLEEDMRALALMALGKSECIFESDNDFVNIIAENIRKDKNMFEYIKRNKNGLREENSNP